MSDSTLPDPQNMLAELRVDIDRIDSDIHRLLMERGEIIERLIGVKARQGGGSAFRPGREADMMRRLAERHQGILPFDTVESIWRIIISTFTYVQAKYSIHVDVSAGDAAMRDSARFHFGFSVPFAPHHGPRAVIAAVAGAAGDLGLVRATSGAGDGAWWTALIGAEAPKVIARVPFVERPDHPAGIPLYVVAKPLAEAAARDVELFAVRLDRWRDGLPAAIEAEGGALVGNAASDYGLSLLLSFPGPEGGAHAARALEAAGVEGAPTSIGSHAAPFDIRRTFSAQRG
jgi:chorismate mutase